MQPPPNITAGTPPDNPLSVQLLDKNDNPVTTNHTIVRLAIASGPTGGKLTGIAAVVRDGVATFKNLRATIAGTYTLTADDGTITAAISSSFTVAAAVRAGRNSSLRRLRQHPDQP